MSCPSDVAVGRHYVRRSLNEACPLFVCSHYHYFFVFCLVWLLCPFYSTTLLLLLLLLPLLLLKILVSRHFDDKLRWRCLLEDERWVQSLRLNKDFVLTKSCFYRRCCCCIAVTITNITHWGAIIQRQLSFVVRVLIAISLVVHSFSVKRCNQEQRSTSLLSLFGVKYRSYHFTSHHGKKHYRHAQPTFEKGFLAICTFFTNTDMFGQQLPLCICTVYHPSMFSSRGSVSHRSLWSIPVTTMEYPCPWCLCCVFVERSSYGARYSGKQRRMYSVDGDVDGDIWRHSGSVASNDVC